MMYAKLILRSARRSARDYLVYIVTLTICTTLFYAFLSVSSRFYKPDIGVEYNFTVLSDGMKVAICAVTLLLVFLIRFVNRYMLRSRQQEFALEAMMGMGPVVLCRDPHHGRGGGGPGHWSGGGLLPVHHSPAPDQLRPALPARLDPFPRHGALDGSGFSAHLSGGGAVQHPGHPPDQDH